MKIKLKMRNLAFLLIFGVIACQPSTEDTTDVTTEDEDQIHEEAPSGTIKNLHPSQFAEMSINKNSQIVDLRSSSDYLMEHIKNAQNFDFLKVSFFREVNTLKTDQPLFLYDQNGSLALSAAELLLEEGFVEIYVLEGGFDNWLAAGYEAVQ